jgi:hypothetical protein
MNQQQEKGVTPTTILTIGRITDIKTQALKDHGREISHSLELAFLTTITSREVRIGCHLLKLKKTH